MTEVITARAIGASHKQNGTPCQDATAHASTEGITVISVADGLGSCELSHEGSAVASEESVRVGLRWAGQPGVGAEACWRQAVERARTAVFARATELGVEPMDLATTLSLAVITPQSVVVGGIGDGVHVLRDRDGLLSLTGMGPASEIANHVDTLLDSSFREHAHVAEHKREQVDGLVMASDGMDRLLVRGPLDNPFPFAGFVHGLLDAGRTSHWRQLDYERLAVSLTESRRTYDDVSFAVARLNTPEEGLTVNMLSGKALQIGRGLCRSIDRGWAICGAPGLVLARLEEPVGVASMLDALLAQPHLWDRLSPSPSLAWPMDAAVDHSGAVFALLVRPAIGATLEDVHVESHSHASALAGGAAAAVAALHELGYTDGELRASHFVVGERGEVQLADLRRALTNARRRSRRRARDERFLRGLHSALHRRARAAAAGMAAVR